MTKRLSTILLVFQLLFSGSLYSQTFPLQLNWQPADVSIYSFEPNFAGLHFTGCIFDPESGLPLYHSVIQPDTDHAAYEIRLLTGVYTPLSEQETLLFPVAFEPEAAIQIISNEVLYIRKQPYINFSMFPFRTNPESGMIEKLVSGEVQVTGSGLQPLKSTRVYANRSVLADGNWIKIKTGERGIYKVTHAELVAAGLNFQGVNPNRIRIFGNGGAMLPEQNSLPRVDDLREIAIEVVSASPEVFAPGDYLLFYAPSPHSWKPVITTDNLRFEYSNNVYSDLAYYFLTIAESTGKRIQTIASSTQPATHQVTTFHDYAVYKPDIYNLAKLGRQWFGEKFYGNAPPLQLPGFHFPDIDTNYRVTLRSRYALKANETTRVKLTIGGNEFLSPNITKPNSYWMASTGTINNNFFPKSASLTPLLEYLAGDPSASAWVEYLELNVRRHLIYRGGAFFFRNLATTGSGFVSDFRLLNAANNLKIWDITAIDSPALVDYTIMEDTISFRLATPVLREFVAFRNSDALPVLGFEPVANQNLHGLESHDLVIVSPDVFLTSANAYADFRRSASNLTVLVASREQIYNEFASGSPDLTAIRDFMKMLFDRAPAGSEPKYLLLYGDGSYDPKDRVANNNNFIPTFQSVESLKLDVSFVTDDYYGLLDDGEGLAAAGGLDLGIGRFPLSTPEQAAVLKRKAEKYLSIDPLVPGNWKNVITMIAHDEDADRHFLNAEEIAAYINVNQPVFTVDKIYLDAYKRVNIPGGYRYPEVNTAINKRVNDGALLINYIGHGGETGWAYSRVLTLSDINTWKNYENMSIFMTATCSFGRFDNPELFSAGEMVVMNPNGGSIALFTTSRLAYSTFNQNLNKSFTRFLFERNNGEVTTLGRVLMKAKNDNGNNLYIRNFVLLGDPSLQPAIPYGNVRTTRLNTHSMKEGGSISGLTKITVEGQIEDHNGNKMTGFNGILFTEVFDKATEYMTNANHSSSTKRPFLVQNSLIHKGKVSVSEGDFSFSFLVPRDVNPILGSGKISYYATDGELSAYGYYDDFLVGGFALNEDDKTGPRINMYLNTPDFKFGDPLNENPLLVAHVEDGSGINSYGLGIGHDIVAFLNEDTKNPVLLNDFFEPDLNSYTNGTITYQFQHLPEGRYSLRLRVFDLNNNSSEVYTEFVVTSNLQVISGNLKNYPNPFKTETWFTLNHNYFDKPVSITIDVFNLTGQLMRSIGPVDVQSTGSLIEPVRWDGTGNNGKPLNSGVYPYRMRIETKNGFTGLLNGKLMIMR